MEIVTVVRYRVVQLVETRFSCQDLVRRLLFRVIFLEYRRRVYYSTYLHHEVNYTIIYFITLLYNITWLIIQRLWKMFIRSNPLYPLYPDTKYRYLKLQVYMYRHYVTTIPYGMRKERCRWIIIERWHENVYIFLLCVILLFIQFTTLNRIQYSPLCELIFRKEKNIYMMHEYIKFLKLKF